MGPRSDSNRSRERCGFGNRTVEGGDAAIVRLYGWARATPLEESELTERLIADPYDDLGRRRQVIEVLIERTTTSCGYGVPVMEKVRERQRADRGRRYK